MTLGLQSETDHNWTALRKSNKSFLFIAHTGRRNFSSLIISCPEQQHRDDCSVPNDQEGQVKFTDKQREHSVYQTTSSRKDKSAPKWRTLNGSYCRVCLWGRGNSGCQPLWRCPSVLFQTDFSHVTSSLTNRGSWLLSPRLCIVHRGHGTEQDCQVLGVVKHRVLQEIHLFKNKHQEMTQVEVQETMTGSVANGTWPRALLKPGVS